VFSVVILRLFYSEFWVKNASPALQMYCQLTENAKLSLILVVIFMQNCCFCAAPIEADILLLCSLKSKR